LVFASSALNPGSFHLSKSCPPRAVSRAGGGATLATGGAELALGGGVTVTTAEAVAGPGDDALGSG
jgi:hypothetical protein